MPSRRHVRDSDREENGLARDSVRERVVAARPGPLRVRAPSSELRDAWNALVSGQWSVVDRFERNGRRFVVARRQPEAHERPRLSAREKAVLYRAAMGKSNKAIAHEMDLSES